MTNPILNQNLPYTGVKNPTLEECADAAGSINRPDGGGLTPVGPYVPPELCVGDFTITQGDCADPENKYQEELAAQVLNASGAPLNIFKLLGVHEQGKMVDAAGSGKPIGSSDTSSIFDKTDTNNWDSTQKGVDVLTGPAWIGYDFGIKLTSFGQPVSGSGTNVYTNVASIRISQPLDGHRALQVRLESSNGKFYVNPHKIEQGTNVGSGHVAGFMQGPESEPGKFMLFASNDPTMFEVIWSTNKTTKIVGLAKVGMSFSSLQGTFTIIEGTTPFAPGDSFSVPVELEWNRVDVLNLPNVPGPVTLNVRQSQPARYWRLVPIIFQGVTNPNSSWTVGKLQIFQVGSSNLDVVQDLLFMENRDRDYADTAIQIKAAYTPFDSVSDLSKFGFQITDIYTFTTTFAGMVQAIGRPLVVGDVLELPNELQYDHNLKPVRKFLEVSDTGWAADGYTTGWKPIIFKFQAQQLVPGQEHRDLFGDVGTQQYLVSDDTLFQGLQQINTQNLVANETNVIEALDNVPVTGASNREFASGQSMDQPMGSYDGNDFTVEDGLPPDGQPYTSGFKLPDPAGIADRTFFRLEYDPQLNLPARLYRFSTMKNAWVYVETDRRNQRSFTNKNAQKIFNSSNRISLTSPKVPTQ